MPFFFSLVLEHFLPGMKGQVDKGGNTVEHRPGTMRSQWSGGRTGGAATLVGWLAMSYAALEPVLLLLVLFLGPFSVYAYAHSRLQRALPALAAGTMLLCLLALLTLIGAGVD
jgi:hypothetical protein